MRIRCPNCKQFLEGEGDLAGREADCPACNTTFTIQAPPNPTPAPIEDCSPGALPPGESAPQQSRLRPEDYGGHGGATTAPHLIARFRRRVSKPLTLILAALGAAGVMGAAFLLIRSAGNITDISLYDYATRRLAKDSAYAGDDLKLAVEMAGYHHEEARTTVIRAGQRLGPAASKEKHYDALRSFIDKEIREVKAGKEEVNADALAGYWFTYSFSRNSSEYSCWSSSGDYVSMALEGKSPEGFTKGTPRRGKWSLTGDRIVWDNGDARPVIYLTPRHLVTRERDGSITHFRRLNIPSSQQAFDELLRNPP